MLGILCYCLSSFQRHFQGERPVSFKFVVCVLACARVCSCAHASCIRFLHLLLWAVVSNLYLNSVGCTEKVLTCLLLLSCEKMRFVFWIVIRNFQTVCPYNLRISPLVCFSLFNSVPTKCLNLIIVH